MSQQARRHAEYYRNLFERVEAELQSQPTAGWLVHYDRQIDDLRGALDWAFSPGGDVSIGVALTAASVPLWMHLSLMEECRGHVEQAMAALGAEASQDSRREMKLRAALGTSLLLARGADAPEVGETWTRVLEIRTIATKATATVIMMSKHGSARYGTSAAPHLVVLAVSERYSRGLVSEKGLIVRRLAAGGRRIRTLSPALENEPASHRMPTE